MGTAPRACHAAGSRVESGAATVDSELAQHWRRPRGRREWAQNSQSPPAGNCESSMAYCSRAISRPQNKAGSVAQDRRSCPDGYPIPRRVIHSLRPGHGS
jgi:hypothetical protein